MARLLEGETNVADNCTLGVPNCGNLGTATYPANFAQITFYRFPWFYNLFCERSVPLDLHERRLTRQFAIGEATVALDRGEGHAADVADLTVGETLHPETYHSGRREAVERHVFQLWYL
jgi:hypothetical protein